MILNYFSHKIKHEPINVQIILLGKLEKENRKALSYIALRFWVVTPVVLEPTTQ